MNLSYALLWIENLAVALLLSATLLACIARLRASKVRALSATAAALAALPVYVWLLWAFSRYHAIPSSGLDSRPIVALAVAFVVSALVVRVIAFRGVSHSVEGSRDAVQASFWPRAKLAVTLVVAIVLHAVTLGSIDDEVQSWLDRVHVEAGSMVLAASPPPVADGDNAAWLYTEASDRIVESGLGERTRSDSIGLQGNGPVDWGSPEVAALVRDAEAVLAILHEAAIYPSYRVDGIGTPAWIGSAVPSVMPLIDALRLLVLECGSRIHEEDAKGAIASLHAAYAMSGHLADLHILITTMVSAGVERRLASILGELLSMHALAAEDLRMLEIEPSFSFVRAYDRALRLEEASALATYAFAFSSKGALLYRIFVASSELHSYRARMNRVHALNAERWSDTVADELDAMQVEARKSGGMLGVAFIATASYRSGMDEADAWRALARVAVAVRRVELESGARATGLAAVVRGGQLAFVPRDPFEGGELTYRTEDAAWSVASVGKNGVDDGGEGDDCLIRVEAP